MSDLTGRVAVITGGGTGIGRAVAVRLAERGAALALFGRRREPLEAVAREAGAVAVAAAVNCFTASVDVCDQAALDAAFDDAARALGPLHLVVANAGTGGPNEPGAADRWDEIVRTNLDGCYFSFRAFERHLAPGADWKHAIAISSCVARFGVAGISAYSAAKAGQLGLVRSLAQELAPKRVLVNAICPGWVETEMAVARMREIAAQSGADYAETRAGLLADVPLARISEPQEMAALVEFLISPGGAAFTGQTLDPNNGAWMG